LEVVRVEQEPVCNQPQYRGRPRKDRGLIARAFVAKALYNAKALSNLPHTDLLIEMLNLQPSLRRICGWERKSHIPSASTFSRAFAQFAQAGWGDRVHTALVQEHVGAQVVMHLSRVRHLEQVGRRRHRDQRSGEGDVQAQSRAPT
jgi:hypothetical protein